MNHDAEAIEALDCERIRRLAEEQAPEDGDHDTATAIRLGWVEYHPHPNHPDGRGWVDVEAA